MSLFSPKNLAKRLLASQGYEINLHPIASPLYTGPKVAFVHIAKCGGSSVDYALRSALAAPDQHRINRQDTLVASMASFTGDLTSLDGSCQFSEHHAINLQKMFSYYLQENWQYISGHVTVTDQLINQFKSDYAFITILRDPVERFISNYIFNKLTNKKSIMLPNCLTTDNVINEAKEILNSQRGWQMANIPTMVLTGRYPKDKDDAKTMQQEVSYNLSRFKVVGFLDRLSNFEKDCKELTGREITIGRRNVTEKLNSLEQIETKQLLKEYFATKANKTLINNLCQVETINYKNAEKSYN